MNDRPGTLEMEAEAGGCRGGVSAAHHGVEAEIGSIGRVRAAAGATLELALVLLRRHPWPVPDVGKAQARGRSLSARSGRGDVAGVPACACHRLLACQHILYLPGRVSYSTWLLKRIGALTCCRCCRIMAIWSGVYVVICSGVISLKKLR